MLISRNFYHILGMNKTRRNFIHYSQSILKPGHGLWTTAKLKLSCGCCFIQYVLQPSLHCKASLFRTIKKIGVPYKLNEELKKCKLMLSYMPLEQQFVPLTATTDCILTRENKSVYKNVM